MSPRNDNHLERLLRQAAKEFVYPPTPDVVARISAHRHAPMQPRHQGMGRGRRWGIAIGMAAVLLLAALAATPPVRAVLYRVLKIGAVQILVEATPSPHPTPPHQATAPPDLVRPSQLSGATTLAAAAGQVDFRVRLPTYPAALGPPDRVFVQDLGGTSVVLVWLEEDGERVDLALFELASGAVVRKVAPRVLERSTVGGRPALWATGPYLVLLGTGQVEVGRLIGGQVLIWEEDGVTYRLETRASLAEARRIAESLAPLKSEGSPSREQEEP